MRVHSSARPPRPDRAQLRFEFWAAPDDAWLSRTVVAAGLGMSVSWLEKFATRGGGPPYALVGTGKRRAVRYRKRDVLAWHEGYVSKASNSSDRGSGRAQ